MKTKTLFIVIATFLISILTIDFVNAQTDPHPEHCQAGFEACMDAADGDPDLGEDCVNGWLACIGYEPSESEN